MTGMHNMSHTQPVKEILPQVHQVNKNSRVSTEREREKIKSELNNSLNVPQKH